jgi:threonine/homoserine/homoserine lactone efflux protein
MDPSGKRSNGVLPTLGRLLMLVATLAGLAVVVRGEGWVAGSVALAATLVLAFVVRDIARASQDAEAHRRAHGE